MYAWFETIYITRSILIWSYDNSEEHSCIVRTGTKPEFDKHISRLTKEKQNLLHNIKEALSLYSTVS